MNRDILRAVGRGGNPALEEQKMRFLQTMTIAAACAAGMVAAHGQVGGDEPGGKPETNAPAPANMPSAIKISGGVLQGLRLKRVDPVYPASARANGIQGQVTLHVIVGKDGHIQSISVVSGPDELKAAALDAVKQWTYKPYLLNGEPVAVDSIVLINFNLAGY
jgi:periplasmic protein TonB